MDQRLRVLHVDAVSGFYKMERFDVGRFWGPIDLGLHLAWQHKSLNIGTGLMCGSIFPGSNRLFFTGFSPCWGGFYVSSMGGAGLVFDNLGINMVSIHRKAIGSSILVLNRTHGEEIEVELVPVEASKIWESGRGGCYAVMDYAYERFGDRYGEAPRVIAAGPAAATTDFGALVSAPIHGDRVTFVDTWAGRGGFGSKLLQQHGIIGIIYGGTYVDEDFRDRKVANEWFQERYDKKMTIKDMEATVKYRYNPELKTGGTFGSNYATLGGRAIAFNYRSIYMTEEERVKIHDELIVNHYLKQYNEDLEGQPKSEGSRNCGEPCVAICKKMQGQFKKDYEPYQTMGPLCGIFDQRAAEKLNHHADILGFDAISVGGVLAWLMECLDEDLLSPEDLGVTQKPAWSLDNFSVVTDSMHNAELGVALLDSIVNKRGELDLSDGARTLAKRLANDKNNAIADKLIYLANAEKGWMVPNQYWNPGVLSPMPIMGKYYMYYGNEFLPPRELGQKNAERFLGELTLDNGGFCRFHRGWAEEMIPELIGQLFGDAEGFVRGVANTAAKIGSRNNSVYWESTRNIDFLHTYLKRKRDVSGNTSSELALWLDRFEQNKEEAALEYWYEVHKGIYDKLSESSTAGHS